MFLAIQPVCVPRCPREQMRIAHFAFEVHTPVGWLLSNGDAREVRGDETTVSYMEISSGTFYFDVKRYVVGPADAGSGRCRIVGRWR